MGNFKFLFKCLHPNLPPLWLHSTWNTSHSTESPTSPLKSLSLERLSTFRPTPSSPSTTPLSHHINSATTNSLTGQNTKESKSLVAFQTLTEKSQRYLRRPTLLPSTGVLLEL